MMKSIKITNSREESIRMILSNPESSEFAIESIDGLGPEQATINSTENSMNDGSIFDLAKKGNKVITFNLIYYPEDGDVERVRHKSYNYFPVKEKVRIDVETSSRTAYIEGYVESNTPSIWSDREGAQITVVCMDPYFKSLDDYIGIIIGQESEFLFPFSNESLDQNLIVLSNANDQSIVSVYYGGDTPVGFIIDTHFSGNPGRILEISNIDYNESVKIDFSKLPNWEQGGVNFTNLDMEVSTVVGDKRITAYPRGVTTNWNKLLLPPSVSDNYVPKWPKLYPGFNRISVHFDYQPNVETVTLKNKILYGGM